MYSVTFNFNYSQLNTLGQVLKWLVYDVFPVKMNSDQEDIYLKMTYCILQKLYIHRFLNRLADAHRTQYKMTFQNHEALSILAVIRDVLPEYESQFDEYTQATLMDISSKIHQQIS